MDWIIPKIVKLEEKNFESSIIMWLFFRQDLNFVSFYLVSFLLLHVYTNKICDLGCLIIHHLQWLDPGKLLMVVNFSQCASISLHWLGWCDDVKIIFVMQETWWNVFPMAENVYWKTNQEKDVLSFFVWKYIICI